MGFFRERLPATLEVSSHIPVPPVKGGSGEPFSCMSKVELTGVILLIAFEFGGAGPIRRKMMKDLVSCFILSSEYSLNE